MGADLVLAITKLPDRDKAVAVIDALSDEHLDQDIEYVWGDDVSLLPPEEQVEERERMRDFLKEAVEVALDTRRDLAQLTIDGKQYAVTGGMTWGDDPTDAYRYINALEYVLWDQDIA